MHVVINHKCCFFLFRYQI